MNIFEKLSSIQKELKAPKGQYNSFGKYKYRSAEDILEAVKPICNKHKAVLKLTDSVVEVGGRIYIEASAILHDLESSDFTTTTAYAREPEQKKGMDASQVTGTASSYARKYALNGLFNIDDTKDADTNEYYNQTSSKASTRDVLNLRDLIIEAGQNESDVCKKYKVSSIEDLTETQVNRISAKLNKYMEGNR